MASKPLHRDLPGAGLDDGEALAAFGATGGENLATALGGVAGAEADLAGAFLFVRAEGGLHGVLLV